MVNIDVTFNYTRIEWFYFTSKTKSKGGSQTSKSAFFSVTRFFFFFGSLCRKLGQGQERSNL